MYLYVLRHGQTDWNIQGKMLTFTEIGLNSEGIEQCKKAKEIVEKLDYDVVFCSPKLRTRQTLDIVNDKDVPVFYDERLVERNARTIEGKLVSSIDNEAYWIKGKDILFDAETIEECEKRIKSFLEDLKSKYPNKNALIVTHNGICRIFNEIFNGAPKTGNIYKLGQGNADIKIYKF